MSDNQVCDFGYAYCMDKEMCVEEECLVGAAAESPLKCPEPADIFTPDGVCVEETQCISDYVHCADRQKCCENECGGSVCVSVELGQYDNR